MAFKAPPGSWRQLLVLIMGFLLLLIFAPSASSASSRLRTKRVIFVAKDIDNSGICSIRRGLNGKNNNDNDDGDRNDRNDSNDSSNNRQKKMSIDPSKWKQLSAPHSLLQGELIGGEIESSTFNATISRSNQEQGDENDDKDEDAHDDAAAASIGTWEYDQWYVLNGIQQRQDVSYMLKIAFPLEIPINVDLDVSVWNLAGAQAQIADKIRLADHYSEDSVFVRVQSAPLIAQGACAAEPRQVEYSVEVDRLYWGEQVSHSGLKRGVAILSGAGLVAVAMNAVAMYMGLGGRLYTCSSS